MLSRALLPLLGQLLRGKIPNQLGLTVERFIQHSCVPSAQCSTTGAPGMWEFSLEPNMAIHLTVHAHCPKPMVQAAAELAPPRGCMKESGEMCGRGPRYTTQI